MKILVSALEHSANVHLKSLQKELHQDTQFIGIFDASLGKPIIDLQSLAIMGFIDVIKKLRFFLKLNKEMLHLAKDADKILLIDSSGFNLPLAKKIKKRYPEKEIIYYILPQAWAWKKKRIPVLAQTIDHLASILPFEPDYYPSSAPITYVGHPLLDQITTFKSFLNTEIKEILFMPGSRKGEIKKLMPIYVKLREHLNIKATLVIPQHFTQTEVKELYPNIENFIISQNPHEAMLHADFAFICSGTATLEAAIIGIPFTLTYIAKSLDYFIASKLVNIEYIGLSNIMFTKFANKTIHPELIQEDVTLKNLLLSYEEYDRDEFLQNSKLLRKYLQHGSSKTVAQIIES